MTAILFARVSPAAARAFIVTTMFAVLAFAAAACNTADAGPVSERGHQCPLPKAGQPHPVCDGLTAGLALDPTEAQLVDGVLRMPAVTITGCVPEAGCQRIGCAMTYTIGELCVGPGGAPGDHRVVRATEPPPVPLEGPGLAAVM